MSHPETMSLPRPCPGCGGKLQRTTVDPSKPLGMVACTGCQFKSPINVYVKNVQTAVMAQAQSRKAQG